MIDQTFSARNFLRLTTRLDPKKYKLGRNRSDYLVSLEKISAEILSDDFTFSAFSVSNRGGNAYKSGNFADFKVYGVTLDSVLPFVASGAFLPEFDFNGNPIQVLGTESDVDEVAFNVTVLGNVTVGVFGWWGQCQGPANRFVDSFASLPDEEKATALATCAFEYLENLYLRESWWNSLSQDEKLKCDDLIHSGVEGERSHTALRDQHVPRLAAKVTATLDCRPKTRSDSRSRN